MHFPLAVGDCLMINDGFGCVYGLVGDVAMIRMQNNSTGRMSTFLAAYLVEEMRRSGPPNEVIE